jgi:hypothetical protein
MQLRDATVQVLRAARDGARLIGYLRARWPPPVGTRPAIGLAVCAIFRDEARYLAEWVTFHRLQGVERFYLYDNRSTDDWRSELEPELAGGTVEVSEWPHVPGQRTAYEDCLARHRLDARWIAFIDADEFLFSPTGRPLPDVLRDFDTYPGVVVNWRIYGANGWEHPPEGLVSYNYLMRGPDDHPANALVKSIVYPRRTLGWFESAHYFRLRGNPVGEDRRPALRQIRVPGSADLLRINHYYAKSEEQFRRKSARPNATSGTITDRFGIPPDAVRDEVVLQFGLRLRASLAQRSSAPGRQVTVTE